MSGTRSPSLKAPATEAILVSHGQPSDPAPAEARLAELAAKVAARMPGRRIGAATLAAKGSVERALDGARDDVLIYPLFMTEGWFTNTALPARLGLPAARVLPPLGSDPALPDLTLRMLSDAASSAGWSASETEVLVAAHGSAQGAVPAACTRRFAEALRQAGTFARIEVAFLEEPPHIHTVAAGFGPKAICLSYFAADGGHVTDDLPAALSAGGFRGPTLPPLALWPAIPALIADALCAAARLEHAS
ncbi:cobalamin biosynthesis protein CbiX [Fluviibacterium sp. S390]|uniref:cobalamin biosynthesis protein CbiX n=1 Tax=Fluviibacterium sp. S390 TaxID=3415139 RepID=UPI003C7E0A2A